MKWLGGLFLFAQAAGGGGTGGFDFGPISEVVVLHEGRAKPIDTMAREVLHIIAGGERFYGYKDPGDPKKFVAVFERPDPVANVLRLIAQPSVYRTRSFIKIQHPEVREKYGKDKNRQYFSPDQIAQAGAQLQKELRDIQQMEEKDRGPYHRSVQELNRQYGHVRILFDELILRVIPLPYGGQSGREEEGKWPSLPEIELYLDNAIPPDTPNPEARSFLAALARVEKAKHERARDLWAKVKESLAGNRPEEFNRASADLRDLLRSFNPGLYPSPGKVAVELRYNRTRPFTKAYRYGFMPAVFLFLLAFIFRASWLRWAGIAGHLAGVGLGFYGYALRWEIAARYPLSNMYESMIAMGMLLAIVGIIFEFIYRSRVFGLCAAVIAFLCMAGAESIPIFSPYVNQLPPSLLNQVIMTIHVPTIMAAYGCGLLCMGIGVAYILVYLFSPGKTETLDHLDLCLYRVLQVTVLLFIGGIALGAVWAGEAWGRYWGWDMKEVWALISLLWYLAMLHARMTGKVKGLVLSSGALIGFVIVLWSYIGVNVLFGKGLHTYGFVLGATWFPLLAITGLMFGFVLAGAIVALLRKSHGQTPGPEGVAP